MVQQIYSIIKYELIFVKQTRSVFTTTLSPDSSSHIITFLQVIAQNLTPEVINLNSTLVSPLVSLSVVPDSAIPWSVACQAPLFMEFSRQEYWSGLPFPSLRRRRIFSGREGRRRKRIFAGIKPGSLALQADSLPSEPPDPVLFHLNPSLYASQERVLKKLCMLSCFSRV